MGGWIGGCVGYGQLTTWPGDLRSGIRNTLENEKLRRIVEYVHSTFDLRLIGFIGDRPDELELVQYSDAGFASDHPGAKSTSGVFLAFVGPMSFSP